MWLLFSISHASSYREPAKESCGIHMQIIYNTGPIQEIQQATEVVGKEDHHVFYYIVIWKTRHICKNHT